VAAVVMVRTLAAELLVVRLDDALPPMPAMPLSVPPP